MPLPTYVLLQTTFNQILPDGRSFVFYLTDAGRLWTSLIAVKRDSDIAECYADASMAKKLLGWQAELWIERACADGWRWQQRNPNGYRH